MWGKHASLPTNKLVLVSKSGFTSTAKRKANWWNIATLDLTDAERYDWESVVKKINKINIVNFLLPYVTGIKLVFDGNPDEKLDVDELDLPNSVLHDPEGNAKGNPLDIARKWLADPAVVEKLQQVAFDDSTTVVEFERNLRDGCYLTDGMGRKHRAAAIQVEAKCRKESSNVNLASGSYGKAQLVHGSTTSFGRPTQVLVIDSSKGEPTITLSIRGTKL